MFGPDAVVRLFGSRVDDSKRGGDVDLHVVLPRALDDWRTRYRFIDRVQDRSDDDRKIDLILLEPGKPLGRIDDVALRDGIVL
jgi:hypothetical protein